MAESNPLFLTNLCVVAADFRRFAEGIVCSEGVAGPFPYAPGFAATTQTSFYTGSLAVSTGGSGLDLSVLAGSAYIDGDDATDQGMYWVENDAPATLTVGAADPTNPRIDIVVATVRDSDYGGVNDDWILQVVAGTATVGATLSNLTGAPAVPTDSLLLGYVLVPALFAGPFVNATHIKDARIPYGMCESGLPRRTLTVGGNGEGTATPFNFVKANYPWLRTVRVRLWAGGGGGGGGNGGVVSGAAKGGGGGGGGYAEAIIDADLLAATEVCTAGAPGSGGSATGGNGGAGGTSSFGTWLTAGGGTGGTGMTPATTGNNGAAGGSGGLGALGAVSGYIAEGGDGQGAYVHTGFGNRPNGGPAAGGGGGGGRGGDGASAATAGGVPGGGGGGGGSSTGNAGQTGAVGGDGAVVLELFG